MVFIFVPQWSQLLVITLLMFKYFNQWLDTDESPTSSNTNATSSNTNATAANQTSTPMSNALYYYNMNGIGGGQLFQPKHTNLLAD